MKIIIMCSLLVFVPGIAKGQVSERITPERDTVIVYHSAPEDWLKAIIYIESGVNGKNAYNVYEPEAKGLLCIFPILVEDVNRILGFSKYTLDDRLDDSKSIEIFWIYQRYYNPGMDFEKMCRIWCGGPDGHLQECTIPYFNMVKDRLEIQLKEKND